MDEKGIAPPPLSPLNENQNIWVPWDMWFRRLVHFFPRVRTYSVTWSPAATAANSAVEQTVAVTGLSTQDIVCVSPPGHTAGIGLAGARASAADTLAVVFVNPTAGSKTAPSGDYLVCAIRR